MIVTWTVTEYIGYAIGCFVVGYMCGLVIEKFASILRYVSGGGK